MEVQLEAPGGLLRQLKVRIPAENVAKAVDQRLKQMSARAKIPGFRPGKAPFKVIQQQYGASARLDAVSDLVQKSYPEALGQAGVNPAGMPKIDITAETEGQPLEYTASFEVYPEIVLQGLSALAIEKPVVNIQEADIDKLVDNLRKGRRELEAVSRAATAGDQVSIDFDGKIDGVAFQGGKGEKVEFEIGAGQFLPDLENGIVGHAAGESFTVPVSFPEDYRSEELKGKTAHFDVVVHEVKGVKLPDLDDAEFLKAHNVESAAALREKGLKALESERDKAVRGRLKAQALEQLLAQNPIDVPSALIEQEVPRLREDAAQRMNMRNLTPEKRDELLPASLFEQTARRRVALGLLIGEVLKERAIKLDPARVDKALDDMAADYEQPEEVKQYYRSNAQMMQGLSAVVLEDQVVESLLDGITPTEQPMSLEQLLNPQAQA
ncbi:MAG: trigger factor [Hydrocarboniphaga sp.]|uniref:trigger factor n=1 Tax=Hydrocarboniphaga sp. TaxID=2033016 RepID=UPI002630FA40|nr:trigger factor [Hydrocarboniphaga sp.]MDB5971759.1 trigger factor [Hydrocarboniphaga sp.]